MALVSIEKNNPAIGVSKKNQFENRLRLIGEKVKGIKSKDKLLVGYTLWRIFSDVTVVRCYNDYYTFHTNGDITHYEVKKVHYKNVRYECTDLEFIANILETDETRV